MKFHETVVVAGVRTPTGIFGGSLSSIPVTELGALVIRETMNRANISGELVDEVIFGTHFQAGIKANCARQCAVGAGLPFEVPAFTPNKNCGTGLKAVNLAAEAITAGNADIIVAGGGESMSRVPYLASKARFGYRMGNDQLLDSMFYDGLIDPFMNYHMGITAENLAEEFGISREEQDEFACRSHTNAARAEKEGLFNEQIVKVDISTKKQTKMFEKDETIRPDISMEEIAALKPAFKKDGTVTPANASGINDGAAAVLMMSAEKAKELGLKPRVKVSAFTAAGVHPSRMGYGPVPAVNKLLARTGLKVEDIDLWELNEAFAVQALVCIRELKIDTSRVNVNGGAIALGHPVGCTGARLVVSVMHELERRNAKRAVISMCIGGGQGIATLIERCE
ncbi:MAG TPA: thiolase family protein [Anaerovoracaceae bacterium]|nr:thiolase family protein [Anaerovoracaceae bacterium]